MAVEIAFLTIKEKHEMKDADHLHPDFPQLHAILVAHPQHPFGGDGSGFLTADSTGNLRSYLEGSDDGMFHSDRWELFSVSGSLHESVSHSMVVFLPRRHCHFGKVQ